MQARVIQDGNGVKKLELLSGANSSGVPLGTILAYYGARVPTGFLPCNGMEFDVDQYPVLYAYLGTNKLPDLRGRALMGYNDVTTNGKLAAIGETQEAQLPSITGWDSLTGGQRTRCTLGASMGGAFYGQGWGSSWTTSDDYTDAGYKDLCIDSSRSGASTDHKGVNVHIGNGETRPANFRVNFIIKAVTGYTDNDGDSLQIAQAISNGEGALEAKFEEFKNELLAYTWFDETLLAGREKYRDTTSDTVMAPIIPANTEFAEPLTNFEEIRFYSTRSTSSNQMVPYFTIKTQDLKDAQEAIGTSAPNIIIPGYGSEYREFSFDADLTKIVSVWGSERVWKITGIKRIN